MYFVYIITNKNNSVLYTGITNNLERRMSEHINKFNKKSFSARYNISKLVYYEIFNNPLDAIAREKQIKAGSRRKKINLIERYNSNWRDLSDVTAAEDFLKQISLQ